MLMNVKDSRTSHGVRVVTSAMPHVESVACGIWVGVGSRHEPAALSGISHFTEHLLFKGTTKRSARDISVAIEGRGGYLNAFTSEEQTCYYCRVGYDQMERGLDVLADMYRNSRFAPEEIKKERGVIIEEIMMYRDQPRHQVHEVLSNSLWPDHPLGRPVIGTPETLARMTQRSFKKFVGESYVPRNTVVAFAGRVDHAACVDAVEHLLSGKGIAGKASVYEPVNAQRSPRRAVFQPKAIEQTHLALGFRLFGFTDERRHPLKLMSAILGENMSSRLFQIVREKHGLAYSVNSGAHLFRESGALIVSAGLDRKRKTKALALIVKEIRRLREKPVTAAELKQAQDYVIGQMRLGLESTSHQMMWVGENLLSRGRFITPEETMAKLQRVTAAEIQKLANQVLRMRQTSLAIISPDLGRDEQSQLKSALATL